MKYDSEVVKEWAKAHGLMVDGLQVADLFMRLDEAREERERAEASLRVRRRDGEGYG